MGLRRTNTTANMTVPQGISNTFHPREDLCSIKISNSALRLGSVNKSRAHRQTAIIFWAHEWGNQNWTWKAKAIHDSECGWWILHVQRMNLRASHYIVHVCKHHENEHNAARHPCLNHCAHFGPRSKSHHGSSRLCKQITVFYVQVQLLECQRTFCCNCSSMCPKDAVYNETWYVSKKMADASRNQTCEFV